MADPIQIIEDLVDGAGGTEGPDGSVLYRHLLVKNLPRDPATSLVWRAMHAETEDGKAVPFVGQQHPGDDSLLTALGLTKLSAPYADADTGVFNPLQLAQQYETAALYNFFLESVEAVNFLDSRTTVRLRLRYRDLSVINIKVNGVVVRDQTRFDAAGNVLIVPLNPKVPNSETAPVEEQVLVPNSIVEYDYYDIGTWADDFPFGFQGAINSDQWQGKQAQTWVCENILGGPWIATRPTMIKHRRAIFRYEGFDRNGIQSSFNRLLWFKSQRYPTPPAIINPKKEGFTGGPIADPAKPQSGSGWKYVQMQPAKPFATLKLPPIFKEQFYWLRTRNAPGYT